MIPLRISTDRHGNNTNGIPLSDTRAVRVLSAGAGETITVPADASYALFSGTDNFYVDETSAAVPSSDADTGAPELNPVLRKVSAGDVLGIVAPAAATVIISFYS